jgi:hypothetical protein
VRPAIASAICPENVRHDIFAISRQYHQLLFSELQTYFRVPHLLVYYSRVAVAQNIDRAYLWPIYIENQIRLVNRFDIVPNDSIQTMCVAQQNERH